MKITYYNLYSYYNMKLILVDASFNSFYRFFATLRWFQFSHKEEFKKIKNDPSYDWFTNEDFKKKYEKMYLQSIESYIKDMSDAQVIFCQDAKQNTIWRHKLISSKDLKDSYKGERPDLESKYNFKNLFNYTYKKMIPKFAKEKDYPIFQLQFPETEADDIIATICIHLKKTNSDQEIIIVSGDDDFTQLGRDNVSILNFHKKKFITNTCEDCKEKLRLKIIMGDKSDNIPSIFPKVKKGEDGWVPMKDKKAVKESEEQMNTFLKENPHINKRFKLNQKLIDFNKIPKKIQNPVIKKFKLI